MQWRALLILVHFQLEFEELKYQTNSSPQNLPVSVATRLAAGEKIAPELHEDVAVLFAGVVGRSSMATFSRCITQLAAQGLNR